MFDGCPARHTLPLLGEVCGGPPERRARTFRVLGYPLEVLGQRHRRIWAPLLGVTRHEIEARGHEDIERGSGLGIHTDRSPTRARAVRGRRSNGGLSAPEADIDHIKTGKTIRRNM